MLKFKLFMVTKWWSYHFNSVILLKNGIKNMMYCNFMSKILIMHKTSNKHKFQPNYWYIIYKKWLEIMPIIINIKNFNSSKNSDDCY